MDALNTILQNIGIEKNTSILIGKNGCGKSRLLDQLRTSLKTQNITTVAIANCIHDKFTNTDSDPNFLGARLGLEMSNIALISALESTSTNENIIFTLGKILDYAGYQNEIGISLPIESPLTFEQTKKIFNTVDSETETNRIISSINFYLHKAIDGVLWIEMHSGSQDLISRSHIVNLIKFSRILNHEKRNNNISFTLRKKNGQALPFEKISSGESNQITFSFFIASKISQDTVIFIDEPENSLHPEWQREYINNLNNLFHYYNPKFIIATHSPLLISDECITYRIEDYRVVDVIDGDKGIEETLWRMFEIIEPESSFLSRQIVHILEDYSTRQLSQNETIRTLKALQRATTDIRQRDAISEIISLLP